MKITTWQNRPFRSGSFYHQFKNGATGTSGIHIGKSSRIMDEEFSPIFHQCGHFGIDVIDKKTEVMDTLTPFIDKFGLKNFTSVHWTSSISTGPK